MAGARFKNIPKVSAKPTDVEVSKAIAAMRYNIEQLINNGLAQGVFDAQFRQIPASAIAQQTFGEAQTDAPDGDVSVPPDGPVLNLTATGAYTTVVLSWDAPLRWDYFEVWRSEDNIIGNAVLLNTVATELFNDSPPQADTDYYYWVRPVHDGLNGPWAGPAVAQVLAIDVTGDTTPPPGVTGFTGTPAYTTIILEWNAAGGTTYEYEIWRYTSGGSVPPAEADMIGTTRALVYADAPPAADTNYYYWIRARSRADVNGPYSEVIGPYQVPAIQAADPGPDLDPPGTPQGLYVFSGIRTLILQWGQPNDNDIDYVEVYRNLSNDVGTAILIGKTKATVYVDSIFPEETNGPYYYWVRAVDTSGNVGNFSLSANGTLAEINTDELGDGSITETKIQDDSISTPKLQANAVVADIIATGAIIAEKIAAGEITADKLAAASVIAGKIAADAVDANSIQANAITTTKLDAGAVTAAKIAVGSIAADKLAAAAVTADKINAGAVTTDKLDANAVTAEKIAAGAIVADSAIIADGAITNAKIGNAAVTNAKISGVIRSNNYVAGVSGWQIDKDGDVEFDSGKFRGTIEAGAVVVGELVGYGNLLDESTFRTYAPFTQNINAAGAGVWTLLHEWTPPNPVEALRCISTVSFIFKNYSGNTATVALRFTAIQNGTPFVTDLIGGMVMRPRIAVGLPESSPTSYTYHRGLTPTSSYTFQWYAKHSAPDAGVGNFEFSSIQSVFHLLRK